MSNNTKQIIGQRINTVLAIKNIKQKDLATSIGVSDNIISYFVSGKRTPNTEQIIAISKYLDVSSDYLLGLSDAPTNDKDLQFICDYTGLSLKSISMFHNFAINSDDEFLNFIRIRQINDFLESNTFKTLVEKLIDIGVLANPKIDTSADYKKFDDTTLNDEISTVNDTVNFSKSLYFDLQYSFLKYYQQTSNVCITDFENYCNKLVTERAKRIDADNFKPLTTRDLIYQIFTTKGESNADD